MKPATRLLCWLLLAPQFVLSAAAQAPEAGSFRLTGDLSARMVAGIDAFLDRELAEAIPQRTNYWKRDFSSAEAYVLSVAANRARLAELLGAYDRLPPGREFQFVGGTATPARVAETERYTIHAVRWPALRGIWGEGLLLEPKSPARASVLAVPDADVTPEQLCGLAGNSVPEANQFPRRLAEAGCRVLVPVLISRDDAASVDLVRNRATNLPHREWLWRMAFEVGRHPLGFEVAKLLAAVDLLAAPANAPAIGIIGHGEGGAVALHAAALDPRLRAAVVSGYFDSRQNAWAEPPYRTVWAFLREFGDAELASLVAPRKLIIEHSPAPEITGPPAAGPGKRNCAAPGRIVTPDFASVEAEVDRARALGGPFGPTLSLVNGSEGAVVTPGSLRALNELLAALGVNTPLPAAAGPAPRDARGNFDPAPRQFAQVKELEEYIQALVRDCERLRANRFWNTLKATNAAAWEPLRLQWQRQFDAEVMGRWTNAFLPLNPRARVALGTNGAPLAPPEARFTAHDVMLDVFPDVFAWGVLLLPKDLKPGERRPVVVCQHGLEGLPEDCINVDPKSRGYWAYKGFASRLAERGFVVFVPHNPYRGGDAFRTLQRKSWLLGQHLFSIIHAQHARILDWLETQPWADPKRIAFYGLSYGGKSAMRIPAVHDRYCLSICSGDFNEWVRKNAATDYPGSYLYTHEYEIFEWNLGHTFNYAEMAALIAPRPFMVERGHYDGVGVDEWVDYEYAKVRRFYTQLGLADRTEIEHFPGPHTINGQGSFDFLHRHLNWPKPQKP